MEASFDTLEKAAEYLASTVLLTEVIGPIAPGARMKTAMTTPDNFAQGLQWATVPGSQPTLPTPSGTARVDPAWGTLNKALLGAGLGAGGMGLSALVNEKRRKHWLRNMLLGGLLGGGLGGGLGAIMHSTEGLKGGPEGSTKELQALKDFKERSEKLYETPGGSTVWDRLAHLRESMKVPGMGPKLDALDAATPYKGTGAIGAGIGGGVGALGGATREHMHKKKLDKYETATQNHKDKLDALKRMSTQERIKSLSPQELQKLYPEKWQAMQKKFLNATPGKANNPASFAEAFPTLKHPTRRVGPTSVKPAPKSFSRRSPSLRRGQQQSPRHAPLLNHAEWHNLKQRATGNPTAPVKPSTPLAGKKLWGTVGAVGGSLLPQLLRGPSPFDTPSDQN